MPMPEDTAIRLVRPFADNIMTVAKVLDLEAKLGILMTRDEMMHEAMKICRGLSNPKYIKEMVDQICEERGYGPN